MGVFPAAILGGLVGALIATLYRALVILITGRYPSKNILNLTSSEKKQLGLLNLVAFIGGAAVVGLAAIIDMTSLLIPSAILAIAILIITDFALTQYAKKLSKQHEQTAQ